jgi:hypothetical protein
MRSEAVLLSIMIGFAVAAFAQGTGSTGKAHRRGAGVEQTRNDRIDYRGRAFIGLTDFTAFAREEDITANSVTLTSPELDSPITANEAIVSWNADAPNGTGLKVEARATTDGHWTKYYTLGLWSPDGVTLPRVSVKGQKDGDGDVHTDTLALHSPLSRIQLRVTLTGTAAGGQPKLKFLSISLADTDTLQNPLLPNRAAWGKEVEVPGRTQSGWPGASGWCSPTSTSMALAYWSKQLNRPELDIPVPDAAHAIYDKVYDGTGNWPFNTAFAGSFPGIRAYVTRFSDIRELEDWSVAGIPVVVSVSYDLLRGKAKDEDPGHLMVCDGFTVDGDIVLNDPAHHPERGEVCRKVFPRANFVRAWGRSHETVYLIYPLATSVPTDPYGHWAHP